MKMLRGTAIVWLLSAAAFLAGCGTTLNDGAGIDTASQAGVISEEDQLAATDASVPKTGKTASNKKATGETASVETARPDTAKPDLVKAEEDGQPSWMSKAFSDGEVLSSKVSKKTSEKKADEETASTDTLATDAAKKSSWKSKAVATQSAPAPGQPAPGTSFYLIGPADMLEITVFKVPELSKAVQVSETGSINLPLLGSVNVAGKTAQQVERDLTVSLGSKYLQKPQVNVLVREYNSQRITLEGAGIKKPGVYPLRGRMTLLQLVASADGVSEISDSQFAIFRERNGKRAAVRFDLSAIRSGEAEDPILQAGDVVVASSSATKEAFNNVIKALPLATVLRPF